MTHLDHVVLEVQGLDLGERAAGADHLGGELGDGGAEFVLAGRGDAASRQKRGTENHARTQPLVLLAIEATVVVGQRVEVEVVDQSIQSHADRRTPGEVLFPDRVIEGEDLPGEVHAGRRLCVGDLLDALPQVIELEHLDVGTERGRQQCQVGRDIQHARVDVAHQAVPGMPKRSADMGGADPPADALPRRLLTQPARYGAERDPGATEHIAHLGHRALAAVREPHSRVEVGVIHLLRRLQVDHEDRRVRPLGDRQHHRRGEVGREEHDDQVAVGHSQLLGRNDTLLRVGDEPDVRHLGIHGLEPFRHVSGRLLELGQQPRKLGPIGAEAAGDEADACPAALLRWQEFTNGVRGHTEFSYAPQPAWVPPTRSSAICCWYPDARYAANGSRGSPRDSRQSARSARTSV